MRTSRATLSPEGEGLLSVVIVAARFVLGERLCDRMLFQKRDGTVDVLQQQVTQVTAYAVADQDALDYQVLPVRRHRIGRNLPSSRAEPVGEIVKVEAVVFPISEHPADCGKSSMAIVNDAEWPHVADLSRQILGRVVTAVLNFPVAFKTQPEKIVVLADDLTGRTREVQRKGRHIAAQIVDMEDQIFRQVRVVAPHHPADAERSQAKLVPRRID